LSGNGERSFHVIGSAKSDVNGALIKPQRYANSQHAKAAEDHLPPSPVGGLLRGIRRLPLCAQIGFLSPIWLCAWLLFFRGLDRLISNRLIGAVALIGSALTVFGVTTWLIRPL
jgi:hypothetical protein